jgi:hypothetical protein
MKEARQKNRVSLFIVLLVIMLVTGFFSWYNHLLLKIVKWVVSVLEAVMIVTNSLSCYTTSGLISTM